MEIRMTDIHYAVSHWCRTVVPACTCEMEFDENFPEWTEDELKVTCKKCLDELAEWEKLMEVEGV